MAARKKARPPPPVCTHKGYFLLMYFDAEDFRAMYWCPRCGALGRKSGQQKNLAPDWTYPTGV